MKYLALLCLSAFFLASCQTELEGPKLKISAPAVTIQGGSDFCPPGQAKKGRCRGEEAAWTDAGVRAALIHQIGDKGRKDDPGPTYGCKLDIWQALGVAVTYSETREVK